MAYALTAATLYVVHVGGLPPARSTYWSAVILHAIAASTCYAYLSTLQCRGCGASLVTGAMGLGWKCRKCGRRP